MGNRFKTDYETIPREDTEWMNYRACIDVDNPDIFYPEFGPTTTDLERTNAIEAAHAFCHTCPVRIKCEQYSEKFSLGWGIWGEYVYEQSDRRTA